MPLQSGYIPNFVGGVSQQPDASRYTTQVSSATNYMPSIVEGLRRRPPTQFGKRLLSYFATVPDTAIGDAPLVHFLGDEHVAIAESGKLRVFDFVAGVEKTVSASADALAYITAASPRSDLGALTVADYTFLWNRNVVVANQKTAGSDTLSSALPKKALIFVRSFSYGQIIKVTINGTTVKYQAPSGRDARDGPFIVPANVATLLVKGQSGITDVYSAGDVADGTDACSIPASGLNTISGVTVSLFNSIIVISSSGSLTVSLDDGQSGASAVALYERVQRFSELPRNGVKDFKLGISQDPEHDGDDYYVYFDDPDNNGTGVWTETIGPSVPLGVDAKTMPYVLKKLGDGTFSLAAGDWKGREVGDTTTAKDPSFLGQTVNGMTFWANRLGILAGEDVMFSSSEDLFRFYRKTVATLLDGDPFTLSNPSKEKAIMRHAAASNSRLVVFSDKKQFEITSGDVFSSNTARIDETTTYDCSASVAPVGAGTALLFASRRGRWSALREYFSSSGLSGTPAFAVDDTAQVPKYVPDDLLVLAASPTEQKAALVSASEPSAIYAYFYFVEGDQRRQSAWAKWTLPRPILGLAWLNSTLRLLTQDDSGLYYESVDVSPDATDPDGSYLTHLDGRCSEAAATPFYSAAADRTTITLPYRTDLSVVVVGGGEVATVLSTSSANAGYGTQVVVSGDWSARPYFAGTPYLSAAQLSTLYARADPSPGADAIISGKLQLRFVKFGLSKTGFLEAHVKPTGGTEYVYQFLARKTDDPSFVLDDVPLEDGGWRVPVLANNERVAITLQSDSHLPCAIMNASWLGELVLPARP